MPVAQHAIDGLHALKRRLSRARGRSRGVLILSAGGLGDTVLFRMVLPRMLALAAPDEPVTLLLRRDAARMAFLMPPGVTVLAVDFPRLAREPGYRWQMLDRVFQANFRLVIETDFLRHPNLDEALVRAAEAEEAVAMEPRPWKKYQGRLAANRALYDRLFDSGPAHVDKLVRWSRFADWLCGETVAPPMVRLPDETLPPPTATPTPEVLVQPFSAVAGKQYPPAVYRAVLDALPEPFRMVVLAAPGEAERNPGFNDLLADPRVDLDTSTFEAVVPRLRAARLVISVDTAMMHLAVAVGAPTLCLASAAYVGEIVPYAAEVTPPNVTFIHQPMDCEGCLGDCVRPLRDGMFACVAAAADQTVIVERVRGMIAAAR